MQDLDITKRAIRALFEDIFNGAAAAGADVTTERIVAAFAPEAIEPGTAVVASIVGLATAFPDLRYTIDDLVAEADRAAVRWHWTGTHRAPFRGHPASHRVVTSTGHAMFTLRAGRIIAVALETDRLGFLQAIGVVAPDIGARASAPTAATTAAATTASTAAATATHRTA